MSNLSQIELIKIENLLMDLNPNSLIFIVNNEDKIKKMAYGILADKGWIISGEYVGEKKALEEFYEEWAGR